MAETINVICEVDPTVKLCCINTDCLNHVRDLNVCNLKNVIIGLRRICAGFAKAVPKKKRRTKDAGRRTKSAKGKDADTG